MFQLYSIVSMYDSGEWKLSVLWQSNVGARQEAEGGGNRGRCGGPGCSTSPRRASRYVPAGLLRADAASRRHLGLHGRRGSWLDHWTSGPFQYVPAAARQHPQGGFTFAFACGYVAKCVLKLGFHPTQRAQRICEMGKWRTQRKERKEHNEMASLLDWPITVADDGVCRWHAAKLWQTRAKLLKLNLICIVSCTTSKNVLKFGLLISFLNL